jgi:hypothetical protein
VSRASKLLRRAVTSPPARSKLAQQPPPDRMGEQPQGNRDASAFRCHDGMVHQRGLMEFRPKRALCGAGVRQ